MLNLEAEYTEIGLICGLDDRLNFEPASPYIDELLA